MQGFFKTRLANWGLFPYKDVEMAEPSSVDDLVSLIGHDKGLIARGNGRCYGDSSLGKKVISTLRLNKFIAFDVKNGILTCEAGVLLSEILDVIVPKGFFLPVTPGTKFITVGGAIASNIHGKNHHSEGSFCAHIKWLELVDENGELQLCDKNTNAEFFFNTCGGFGLTGVITKACFTLKPIESFLIREKRIKAATLDEILAYFDEYKHWTYSVAWIDCQATKGNTGKSILMVGEHATAAELPDKPVGQLLNPPNKLSLSVPFFFPSFVLNGFTIKAFNFLYYNKQTKKIKDVIIDYNTFFYPLDAIYHWNRIYGKNGFLQYQFVIPKENGAEGLRKILNAISASNMGSFLAVLKLFGPESKEYSSLNFPFEGYTLALDFKIEKKLWDLLDRLDVLVEAYGGKLYLTKDSRMSKAFFERTYPGHMTSNKVFSSFQSDRLGITHDNE